MTQDQYGQTRGPGYVVRDEAVPDNEAEAANEQSKPMTRFQKVASALLGDKPDQDETDQAAGDQMAMNQTGSGPLEANQASATRQDEVAAAYSPGSRDAGQAQNAVQAQNAADMTAPAGTRTGTGTGTGTDDYWDEPGAARAGRDETVPVTSPDVPVTDTDADPLTRQGAAGAGQTATDAEHHQATQPDMFGTTAQPGNGTTPAPHQDQAAVRYQDQAGVPYQDQAGAATIADVPAGEAAATAGRHAAAVPAETEMRPGESTGALGDFSDLTYGNLIPDAEQFTAQWQQIQFRFVDDPRGSVTEAADVIAQVTAKMEAAIQERQRAIQERQRAIQEQQRSLRGRWGEGTNADTEALRETLRLYKTFLDQLIGSRVS
jgi:hypothetical protein